MRVMVGAAGWAGHVFPAFAIARELRARGHEVLIETFDRWEGVVGELGATFLSEPEEVVFPGPAPPGSPVPDIATAARDLVPAIREFAPDVVIHDLYSLVPGLAGEAAGAVRATMMPHPFPEPAGSEPPYAWGLLPPRTAVGEAIAARARAWAETRPRRRGREVLDGVRAEVGLGPMGDHNMMISERLTVVGTFPQLEYPRSWPAYMHVTGPALFELPHPDVELPPGDDPLVLIAASTQQDPQLDLVRVALEAFAGEPVRIVATANRRGHRWPGPVPANAIVHDWVSYSQLIPLASAVVSRGGHGTLARALAGGVPVVVCPFAGDMAENAVRVAWSGAGVMLPRRLLGPRALRAATARLLGEPAFAARAGEIAAWSAANDGAAATADLLEALA